MCDYQGHEFGAELYPDSVCINGYLYDADYTDENNNVIITDDGIPCPKCNKKNE